MKKLPYTIRWQILSKEELYNTYESHSILILTYFSFPSESKRYKTKSN